MPKISIPAVSSPLAPDMRAFVQRVREALSLFADGAITLDQLQRAEIVAVTSGGQVIPGPAVGGTKDYTPPPAPLGLTANGALATVILDWLTPDYKNHAHTEVWRSTANNLGAAVMVGASDSSMYADATGMTGITYYYWIRHVSTADVRGPYNGTAGTMGKTGLVGGTDLGPLIVQAGNLAPGAVTADKALLDLGGDNLLGNNSFEVDGNGDGLADGWGIYNNSSAAEPAIASRVPGRISGFAQRITWTGVNSSTKGVYAFNILRGNWQPNKTYMVSGYARADASKPVGLGLYWNVQPFNQTAIKNPSLTAEWQRYAFRVTTGATVEASGTLYCSILNTSPQTGYVEFDDFMVEEGDTLSGYSGKLALNTIVAGDGAIANLAVTNQLIGNLAVDTAKMADLAVVEAKIGNGAVTNLKIGNIIQSNNYTPGSAGWIINKDGTVEFNSALFRGGVWAGSINSTAGVTIGVGGNIKGGQTAYGVGTGFWLGYDAGAYKLSLGSQSGARLTWDGGTLTLYDAGGAVVLSSGVGVPWSKVTSPPTSLAGISPAEAAKLAGIQAGADITSTHTAAGIANQGAFATLSQINASNTWSFIANAAIQNGQIGGDIWSSNWNWAQGWYLSRTGSLYCANAYVRGDVQASSLQAGVAMVNTLNIAGDAVTVPRVVSASNTVSTPTNAWTTILSYAGFPAGNGSVIVLVQANSGRYLRLLRNGVQVGATWWGLSYTDQFTYNAGDGTMVTQTLTLAVEGQAAYLVYDPTPGDTATYELQAYQDNTGIFARTNRGGYSGDRTMILLGAKR